MCVALSQGDESEAQQKTTHAEQASFHFPSPPFQARLRPASQPTREPRRVSRSLKTHPVCQPARLALLLADRRNAARQGSRASGFAEGARQEPREAAGVRRPRRGVALDWPLAAVPGIRGVTLRASAASSSSLLPALCTGLTTQRTSPRSVCRTFGSCRLPLPGASWAVRLVPWPVMRPRRRGPQASHAPGACLSRDVIWSAAAWGACGARQEPPRARDPRRAPRCPVGASERRSGRAPPPRTPLYWLSGIAMSSTASSKLSMRVARPVSTFTR
jgi:hypothetical protein